MRLLRVLGATFILGLFAVAAAAPGVLIVQEKAPLKSGVDPNVPITDYLGDELDRLGQLTPVVWSETDAIFRAAVQEGLIRTPPIVPTMDQARDAAAKLRLEYVIYVRCRRSGEQLLAKIELFKNGKSLWRDPLEKSSIMEQDGPGREGRQPPVKLVEVDEKSFSVVVRDGLSIDDTCRTIARTWSELLSQGPLRHIPVKPRQNDPTADPNLVPKLPEHLPVQPVKEVDNKKLLQDVALLLKNGESLMALNMLRDAVDAEPLDAERRIELAKALMRSGQHRMAAAEARRAAQLLPEKIQLRTVAARAWLMAGEQAEAQLDLNEAIARDPDSPDTRSLLAEVSLSEQKAEPAIEHLTKAIEKSPLPELFFKRAVAYAFVPDVALLEADMKTAMEAKLPFDAGSVEERYGFVLELLDGYLAAEGNSLRSLQLLAQGKRLDPEVKKAVAAHKAQAEAKVALLERVAMPEKHRSSHNRRILALKLLVQSINDLETYVRIGEDDALADSKINLNEALKQVGSAREAFRAERDGTSKNARTGTD